ncbi:hypothetical protein B0H16DRAFT_1488036 [Mycena metata]|uniref:F-box domain-containing protein n=1 Tax=Mycena metata TaxID=1033252 RepID=A0AAD7P2E1_9AGAR|nr:hypothetical protein B0H16DRAFT_1488036 [Mycena metata]
MQLDGLRNELAELEASIPRQRILLEEMENRQAAVRAELDTFIFPVLTLPLEITGEIFIHYIVNDAEPIRGCPPREKLLLLTVCRTWRTVALSIPALWAASDIMLGTDANLIQLTPEEVEPIIDKWFGRAGTRLPLSLSWFGGTVDSWSECINTIVCRYAPRRPPVTRP